MLIFLYNFVYSLLFARVKAPVNPWGSLSIEWAAALARARAQLRPDPGVHS